MKKIWLAIPLLMSSGFAQADLTNGSVLSFIGSFTIGSTIVPISGTQITSLNGLVLGTTQLATSDPAVGNIDNPWQFFGNLGAHQTLSNTNVLSASGDTATIDFSGWNVTWNGIPSIDMSSGAWNGNADGVANIVCETGSGCGNGASYTLDYSATVAQNDPSGKGNARYVLHLEGTISAVPVPAAVWLFGSGLIGLVGVARKRKS